MMRRVHKPPQILTGEAEESKHRRGTTVRRAFLRGQQERVARSECNLPKVNAGNVKPRLNAPRTRLLLLQQKYAVMTAMIFRAGPTAYEGQPLVVFRHRRARKLAESP